MTLLAPSPAAHPHHTLVPQWLRHLGPLGLFFVAIVDSSPIPLPIPGSTDLLLLWLVAHGGNRWLFTFSAIAGSLIGGYVTWQIGRKGGEMALQRYVSARLLDRVRNWVERHPLLSVFLPTMLPPPIPLSPFILASGALGLTRGRFLAIFAVARTLRYGFVAWLAVTYGRKAIRLWSVELRQWSTPLLCFFFSVSALGICYGIWKLRKRPRSGARVLAAENN